MKTDLPPVKMARVAMLIRLLLLLALPAVAPAQVITDNFTTATNWGTPVGQDGNMSVGSGRMNYTSSSTLDKTGGAGIPRSAPPILPTTNDWSLQVDAHLDPFVLVTNNGQFSDVFLGFGKTGDWVNTHVTFEFGRGWWNSMNDLHKGYYIEDNVRIGGVDAPVLFNNWNVASSDVSLRMDYSAANHTITYYFDGDGPANGYNWVAQGVANLSSGTYNLNLGPNDTFTIVLIGSSGYQNVADGQAYLATLVITLGAGSNAPVILSQPQSRTNLAGTTAAFTVTAAGMTPLSYQWRKHGTNLVNSGTVSGATTTNLFIGSVQANDADDYSVVVTNKYGAVTSQVAALSVLVPASNTRLYRITDLGVLLGTNADSEPSRINEVGSVVGHSGGHPFLWKRDTGMLDLDVLPGKNMGEATDINNYGTVVGYSGDSYWGWFRSFSWTASEGLSDLGSPPADYPYFAAYAINDQGNMAILNWNFYGPPFKAYLYTAGSYTEIGSLGDDASASQPMAINRANQIAGSCMTLSGANHAFIWSSGSGMLDLGVLPGGTNSFANDLNDSGWVAGASEVSSGRRAFLWHPTAGMHDLGVLAAAFNSSTANGVNNLRQVVGQSPAATGIAHAVLWDADLQIVDLTTRVANLAGWANLDNAVDINDGGQITGTGQLISGARHAFLLDPIPVDAPVQDFTYTTNHGAITITGYTGSGGDVVIPSAIDGLPVAGIGDLAFASCSNLITLSVPNSVTSVGSYAFKDCTSLTTLTFGSGVTSFGDRPDFGCTNLTMINVDPLNPMYSSMAGVVFNPTQTRLYRFPMARAGSYSIPDGVTNIGPGAFEYCSALNVVTIPSSVTEIGDYAFDGCPSLTNVTIPNQVTTLGDEAFQNCSSLSGLYFRGNAPSLGGSNVFNNDTNTTVYYWAGTTGWTNPWGGRPTVMLNPPATSDYTYTTNNGAITITGYTGAGGAVTVPTNINGHPVTVIGTGAFLSKTSLTSVSIPVSVVTIEDYAFDSCANLTSVAIGINVTRIGTWAFHSCSSLASVAIPDRVSSLGGGTFQYCHNLTNVVIGNGVVSIADWAFEYCDHLTSVTIPSSVISLGDGAFQNCSSLTGLYFQGNAPGLGGSLVFYHANNATVYYWAGTSGWTNPWGGRPTVMLNPPLTQDYTFTTNNGAITITGYTGAGGAVTIPTHINGYPVTGIGDEAFYFCHTLTSVTIPPGITSIGASAFFLSSLSSVMIPASVTNIGGMAFTYCPNLSTITVDSNNSFYSSMSGVLFNFNQSALIQYPAGKAGSSYTTPASVTGIGAGAFYDSSLTGITLSASLTNIADSAFNDCYSLTSITIPASVTGIGGWAFYACSSLTNVTIGTNVTSIGPQAFDGCSSLTNITIPASVSSIADWAFDSCLGLTSVLFQGNAPNLGGSNVFNRVHANVYYLPGAAGWGATFGGLPTALWIPPVPYTFTTNNGAITITGYTGAGGAVTVPTNINGYPVTSLGGWGPFYACTSLTSVAIPDTITNIADGAFWGCTSLTSVSLGNSVQRIGYGAFYQCGSLVGISIPDSVASIGFGAFAYCGSLTNVTIGRGVTNLDYPAFSELSGVFSYCFSLTAITVDTNNPAYCSVAGVLFDKSRTTLVQCPGGQTGSYTIPNSVTNVGSFAFTGCTNLNGVTIAASVTSIGDWAFCNCLSLSTVTIPENVTNLGSDAFHGCASLTGVYFKGNAPSLGDSAVFSYDQNATVYYLPGSTGWNPRIQTADSSFGVRTNQFGFNIIGTSGMSTVVEACTSLDYPVWSPVATNTLTGSSYLFRDSNWAIYPARFYRLGAATYGGLPVALWNPQIQTGDARFGVRTNRFGFNITGNSNLVVVVEACTNLTSAIWSPVSTNTLSGGSSYFSDLQWTNYARRFYRLHSP